MKQERYFYILFALIIYLLVGTVCIFHTSIWMDEHYFNLMGENAINMATLAVNSIEITDEELEDLKKISFNELVENKNNKELSNLFTKTEPYKNVKYAYIIRKLEDNNIKYYVKNIDTSFYKLPIGTPLDGIWLLDVIVNEQERRKVIEDPEYYTDKNRYTHLNEQTKILYNKQKSGYFVNNDEWGNQISGMVPIYTKEGQYIGLLGVDIYSEDFYSYRNNIIWISTLLVAIPSLILMVIFSYFHFKYKKEMKDIALRDELTGLYTRAYYQDYAKQQVDKLRRADDRLTVIMADIDDFKAYNDYYGHLKGDEVIKHIGKIFREEIELQNGCPGRYGGEEFIAFIPQIDIEEGTQICESIREKVSSLMLLHETEQESKYLTVSIGICSKMRREGPFVIKDMIEKADKALYRAKREGKNCVRREQ
ncbi:MAG: GGDEF domain-containing protein [Epulopiscium sp.]|nr:GGDEF domain-containing protein [Candidatus Epulonipiscium sp.]